MLRTHNPGAIAPAFSRYSLAVEAPAAARWLFVSGQVGVDPGGGLWTVYNWFWLRSSNAAGLILPR